MTEGLRAVSNHELCQSMADAIEAINQQEAISAAALASAKEALRTAAVAAVGLEGVEDRAERLRIVRWLYWNETRLTVDSLVKALFGEVHAVKDPKGALRNLVGPCGYKQCSYAGCAESVPITSRTMRDNDRSPQCEQHSHAAPPTDEEKRQWEEAVARRRREHEANMAELDSFQNHAGLSDNQIARLYSLLAERMDWEHRY